MFNRIYIDKNAAVADLFQAEPPKPLQILSNEDTMLLRLLENNPILESLINEFDQVLENGKESAKN